jgi:hypothetical protein
MAGWFPEGLRDEEARRVRGVASQASIGSGA